MNNNFKEGQKIGYLTIIKKLNDTECICKCVCGKQKLYSINSLQDIIAEYKKKASCGCAVTREQLPTLYMLWKRFTDKEKEIWDTWENFVSWSKQKGYNNVFSYRKLNRKLPYNKENLDFGLYINGNFYSIEILRKNGYIYKEDKNCFVTSKKIKNIIINNDIIVQALNKQKSKHKKFSIKMMKQVNTWKK